MVLGFLHLLLAVAIAVHQLTRVKRGGVDVLTLIGGGYALAYGVGPAYFQWVDPDQLAFRTGIDIPYAALALNAEAFGWVAWFLYVLGYVLVCFSYSWTQRVSPADSLGLENAAEIEHRRYRWLGRGCVGLGVLLLAIYIQGLGGIEPFFSLAMYLRSDETAIYRYGLEQVAFLKNASMVVLAGSILILMSLPLNWRKSRRIDLAVLVVGLIASVALLIHRAGRLDLAAFLGGFVIANYMDNRRVPYLKVIVGCALFACFSSIGKDLFWLMYAPGENQIEVGSIERVFHVTMVEILFPHMATTTALAHAPAEVPYRYFMDVPIAFYNLLPSGIFGIEKIPTISQINTEIMAIASPIPVDLVGFGIYSLGVVGLVLWVCCFGALAGWLDNRLRACTGRASKVSRAFLGVAFGLRVLYCEPMHILLNSLHVILMVVVALFSTSALRRLHSKTR